MHGRQGSHDDDTNLTLRAPRSVVAVVLALLAHVVVIALTTLLPAPSPPPERISITVQRPAPPPSPPLPPTSPKLSPAPRTAARQRPPQTPTPQTSPVAPELPPSPSPPENRAQLPVVETAATPAPPPQPAASWGERLLASLATTPARAPSGVLAPSAATLDRVAANDAKLHDDENERRLQEDYGPFFRRGIEALRGQWHPEEVLHSARGPTPRCGQRTRTTHAVAVIDRSGRVVDVDLTNASGCPQLDDEAVAAFLRVAHFPNPPAGLFVHPDGTPAVTARYPVRFIVSFNGGLRLDWR